LPIALLIGFGWAFMATDFLAVKAYKAIVWVGICEMALIVNIFARRRLAKRLDRLLAGRCIGCGYDLTGNVSGVCPECGKPIENVVQAK
jgi:hypothetical protein